MLKLVWGKLGPPQEKPIALQQNQVMMMMMIWLNWRRVTFSSWDQLAQVINLAWLPKLQTQLVSHLICFVCFFFNHREDPTCENLGAVCECTFCHCGCNHLDSGIFSSCLLFLPHACMSFFVMTNSKKKK